MNFTDRINTDLKTAMLGRDKLTTETLRMLKSAIMYISTQTGTTEMSEDDLLKIVRKEVKKRIEAAELFRKAGSEESALKEEAEAKILEQYLPAQTSPEEVRAFATELHTSSPELTKGEAIRTIITHFKGQADGKTVSEIASQLFS